MNNTAAGKALCAIVACAVILSMLGSLPNIVRAASNFNIGDTVEVTTNLNVRTGPGTSYSEISDPDYPGYAPQGTKGKVLDGPTNADGYTWWKVDFGPGLYSGWSVEGGLEKVVSTTVSARIDSYSPSSRVEVIVGGSTTISVTFTNTGNAAWNFIAGATAWDSGGNQVANYSKTLSSALQPGQQTTVSWTHTVNQAGDYWLQFGVWKATPYTAENLLDKEPSPSQNLIRGLALPQPTIDYSPSSFSFSATQGESNPSSKTLSIRNSGGGTLSWSVSDDANWLTLSPTSGTSTGETDSVVASVSISGMSAGSYSATITISASGATNTPQTIPVSLTINPSTTVSARIDSYSPSSRVEVTASGSTTISVIFTNTGNTAWNFIAGATVWDSGGNQVANYSKTLSSALQPGQQTTVSWTHTVNQAGDYWLQFGVWKATPYTAENLLDKEPSPSQNLIRGVVSSLPDLVVTNIEVDPSPPTAGGSTTIAITIRNQGNADAIQTFFLEFYFDGTYKGHVYVDGLASGASKTSSWSAQTWPSDTNPHTIRGVVDPDNAVSESDEGNNELSKQFTAAVNQLPTCSISANPRSGDAPLIVTFSISASDSDGSISAWVLDVDGDGNADYSGTGAPPSTKTHTYTNPGTYSVALMVSDNNGANASDTETVNIGTNDPPTCSLLATPTSGNAPLTATFSMTASDSDGSISAWALDADGDGNTDYSGSGNPPSTQAHTYTNPGTYTAVLMVSDNEDATASGTETISVSPGVVKPDLVIEGITWSPTSPSIGQTVTFTVTIKNQGTDKAGSSKVYYFIDNAQQGYDYVSSIDLGATTTETFTWKSQAGAHAVKVVADYKEEITEGDETNNEKTVTFSATALSDLIIESITWSPASPSIGATVTFTITIKNQGTGKAGSSKVYYFVDNAQQGYDYVDSIDPGATVTETFTWKAQDGAHAIKAVADYKEAVAESDETNNEKTVTYSATALSDLVINDITWTPISPPIGDTVTFTVTVKNQGSAKAGSSKVYYFIDNAQQGYDYVSSIDPGATTTETFTWKAQEGQHTIKAVADHEGQVTESDETNNEKIITFSATALSDLIIESITWSPTSPSIGDTVTFTVTIKNQGSGRADSSKVYYFIDEVQQGYDSVYSLDPNETATETFTWDAEEGSHTVMAVADYNDEVVESNETNNETTVSFSLAMEVVSTPRMPSGPTTGTTGTSYSYSTGGASSSYGHSIEYRYDWGDGSYSSWSASTSASHSWTTEGPYTVRAQARCALHTDVVSDWSSGLVVNAKTLQIVSAEIVGYDAAPRDPEVGSTVKLTLSFINTGNTAWTFYAAASLRKPNGTEEHLPLEPVSLDPNQQGSAAWTYKLDMEGKWDVVFGIWQASDQRNALARTEWLRGYINVINIDEIRNNINFKLQQRVTYPPYLLDPDSFATAVTMAWLTVTKPLTGDLPSRYDEFYSAGIDYDCLKYNTLVKARDMLNRGDIASAEEYLRRANTYEKLSNMSFEAATDVFIGNLESAEILARGIKDGCEASVKLRLAVINPKAAKVADYLYIGIDYAIERLIGEEDAAKNALVKAVVTTIFNQVKFKQFDNRTIADYTRNRVGKVTFPMLQDAFRSEEVQFALSKIIKESVVEIEEQVAEDMAQYILDELKKVVNFEQITVKSPVELRVYDSQDQVTGLIEGIVKHNIPRAMYDKGTVTVFFPVGSYRYEVAGVDEGTYGLEVVSVEDKRSNTLHLTNIPTSSKTIHEYTFDWTALTQGEKGVTMKIDSDGDGSFERVINLSGIEEEKEGLPMWAWIAIGLVIGLAVAFGVWRTMGKKHGPGNQKVNPEL